MDKQISIVFSFRNEEETLNELVHRVQGNLERIPVDYELIFVNDASTDKSLQVLTDLAQSDRRIKIINLSRRFGYNQGFMAGLRYSRGDAVITMDADLQDPPEVIPKLIEKWLNGVDVVHTVRSERGGESSFKMWLTGFAYRLVSAISDVELLNDAGNFKLMSRRVVHEVIQFNERDPYLRGLVAWVGFKQDQVSYRRERRFAGKGHFPILRSKGPLKELVSGMTSFSTLPLFVSCFFGFIFFAAAVVSIFLFCLLKLTGSPADLGALNWILGCFFTGIQLLCLGFMGLYISRIWREVSGRPNYIIESTLNFESQSVGSEMKQIP